ncbi:MAG: hypothetical protein U0L26_04675 [Cellulosilyticum sp.]|nr:hypothetical protein [Cellulosilyticum sp.]
MQEINLHLKELMMDWTTKLAKRGIKILLHDEENLVLETINLLDTLCFVTSTGRWIINEIIPDDIYSNGRFIEKNILYYKKK